MLAASQQIPAPALETIEFVGELALTGELRAIRGVLPCALQAQRAGHDLVVPYDNANEAALVNGLVGVSGAELVNAPITYIDGRNDNWHSPPPETRHL